MKYSLDKSNIPKIDLIKTLEEQIKENEETLLELRKNQPELRKVNVTKIERLQHTFRHAPKIIGTVAGAAAGAAFAFGETGLAIGLGTASALITPAREITNVALKKQTKYGESGKFERSDRLQLVIDFLRSMANFLQNMKGSKK